MKEAKNMTPCDLSRVEPQCIRAVVVTARLAIWSAGLVIAMVFSLQRASAAPLTIIDNPAATFAGTWASWATLGYPNSTGNWNYAPAGSGSSTATYQFGGLAPGQYKVYATWVQDPNRATNVPYTINSGGSPTSVTVNQELVPTADATDSGRNFKLLTTVTVTGSTITVMLSNNANEYVVADAVAIEFLGGGTTTGSSTTGGTTTGGSTTTGGTTTGGTTTGGTTTGGTTTGGTTTGGTTTGGTTTGGTTTSGTTTGGSTTGGSTTSGTTSGGTTGATVSVSKTIILSPTDPGYAVALAAGAPVVGYGAFVDLPAYDSAGVIRRYAPGYTPPPGAPVPVFNGPWDPRSGFVIGPSVPGVYEATSLDPGSDGLDNNGNGVVDESDELQSVAPYSSPVRAVRINIRVYDPSTQSVRQVTVMRGYETK